MKCPMLSIACAASQMPVSKLADDCLKEKCAWWDGLGGFCAILKIARHLEASAIRLAELMDKLPK